jgi:glycosyltransferase involved in cell wall biosynthesis
MRVALDCRTVTSPKTGDRTYALNLSRALAEIAAPHELFLYTSERSTLTEHERPHVHPIVLDAWPGWTWTPVRFPRDIGARRIDVAHVQYIIPPASPAPVVTTIHDVAFKRFPRLFPLKHRLLLNWLIPFAAHNSAAVITGSEATKRDLVELYGVDERKIHVTPYAADESYRPMAKASAQRAVRNRLDVPTPYVLSVGVLQPRKNLPRLVRAYGRIADEVPHHLVLVGKEGWAGEELASAVAALPRDKRPVFTGYVADADLPALYAGADLFAYPSLYEGFGLPPLEAMACGTPVITSNRSSLPEVVGEAGVMVDPTDERALSEAMLRLLNSHEERAALSAAGVEQASRFSWKRTAEMTWQVYEHVARS